jgi:hypothetical protein
MRSSPILISLLAVSTGALAAAPCAHAQFSDDASWLTWWGPGGLDPCVNATTFEADLGRRLGAGPAVVARRAGVRLTVEVARSSPDGQRSPSPADIARATAWLSAEMRFASIDGRAIGQRVFELPASSCVALVEALSTAAALFFGAPPSHTANPEGSASLADPGMGLPPPPSPPRVSAPPLAASPPEIQRRQDVALEARADPGRPGGSWAFGARAGGLLGMGDVPRASWGLEAALLARPKSGPTMFAGATVWPAQSGSWNGTVALSIKTELARVGLCPLAWQWTSRELSVCAAFQAGRLTAEGSGLDSSFRQERWKLAVDAGASLTQRLRGGWGASVEARLIAPFRRDRVTVTDSTGAAVDLFRAAPVGGAGIVSFGYWPELIRQR